MRTMVSREELVHLADLARINLVPGSEERLARDLGNILEHFRELSSVQTDSVPPVSGGTEAVNVVRGDATDPVPGGSGVGLFPESDHGFLKVPSVFSSNDEA